MYQFHPLANELPLLEGEDFDALVKSIQENGLLNRIVMTADGLILDGRNRYRACIKAGIELDPDKHFECNHETDPAKLASFVMAENLRRRHLSDAQRAIIAGRLNALGNMPLSNVVSMMNVKGRTAQKASVIVRHGTPETVEAVRAGDLSIDRAYQETRRSPGRPPGSSSVNGLRRVLRELDPLFAKSSDIVLNWPGDPGLNLQVARAAQFFASINRQTREIGQDEAAVA